jgi:hypothetical protein
VNLRQEAGRLRGLPIFRAGRLAVEAPELKVRRASRRPNRLGFAIPGEWRISVTAYPGIRTGDALETLLHELVHLHVGAQPGQRRWHGRAFKETLRGGGVEGPGTSWRRGRAPAPRTAPSSSRSRSRAERRLARRRHERSARRGAAASETIRRWTSRCTFR